MAFPASAAACLMSKGGGSLTPTKSNNSTGRSFFRRNRNETTTTSHNDGGTLQPRNQDHATPAAGVQHHGLAEPLPPYESAVAPTWKRSTKVAMLPLLQPTDGYDYLHDSQAYFRHDYLSVQGSKDTRATPVIFFYHAYRCAVNTSRARRKPRYTDEAENTMVSTPLNAIGPGEVETAVATLFDWTLSWDFVLCMRSRSKGGEHWMADVMLYFNGLSTSGHSIPWNDTSRTKKVEGNDLPSRYRAGKSGKEYLRFTWKFCERSDRPRWGASFTVYYQEVRNLAQGRSEYGSFMELDNPWVFFNDNHTTQ